MGNFVAYLLRCLAMHLSMFIAFYRHAWVLTDWISFYLVTCASIQPRSQGQKKKGKKRDPGNEVGADPAGESVFV